jgi:energy-coupling factor transporter ATP-binding protein EcfA2
MKMSVRQVSLHNFTAFESTEFVFSPGINVLIGANSTGKTHLLKVVHTVLKVCESAQRNRPFTDEKVGDLFHNKLAGVFKPDSVGRLVRRGRGRNSGSLSLQYSDNGRNDQRVHVELTTLSRVTATYNRLPDPISSVYIPSREFLAVYEGFLAAYQQREIAFDETYYDLSLALNALPLRGPRLQDVTRLLSPLEEVISGQVIQESGKFYVKMPEGKLEAHLVAEGYRKLASLIYLITNGSLIQNGILIWDEPEANLNPRLVTVVVKFLNRLVESGVQVFLATHDYLLTQELSALSEQSATTPIRFFSLYRPNKKAGVQIEVGDTLARIERNPILEEFAAHI